MEKLQVLLNDIINIKINSIKIDENLVIILNKIKETRNNIYPVTLNNNILVSIKTNKLCFLCNRNANYINSEKVFLCWIHSQ